MLISKIELIEFREKIEVPVHVAKCLCELIRFTTAIFEYLELSKHPRGEFDQTAEGNYKKNLYSLFRMFSKVARDFNMQTNVGI
jgi:hypothetical protein